MDGFKLAMLICVLLGGDPRAMLVDARIVGHAMLHVHVVNLAVDPVNFLFLVHVVVRLRSIIPEPGKLGRIQEGADCDGVSHIVLVCQPVYIVNELLDCVDNHVSTVVPHEIIIASDDENIHGLGVVGIFKFECMEDFI